LSIGAIGVLAWPAERALSAEMPPIVSAMRAIDRHTIKVVAYPWPGTSTVTRVRLVDVDAPEITPPDCPQERGIGRKAQRRVAELLTNWHVLLIVHGLDSFGRVLALVTPDDGTDPSEVLLSEGLAVPPDGQHEGVWCGEASRPGRGCSCSACSSPRSSLTFGVGTTTNSHHYPVTHGAVLTGRPFFAAARPPRIAGDSRCIRPAALSLSPRWGNVSRRQGGIVVEPDCSRWRATSASSAASNGRKYHGGRFSGNTTDDFPMFGSESQGSLASPRGIEPLFPA
jgi:endonuclease YncB( thermonuclease family)